MKPVMKDSTTTSSSHVGLGRAHKSLLLEDAYQEYCERCEAGETIDADAFCDQYPALKSSLHKLLQVHLYLEDHSSLVREPALSRLADDTRIAPTRWPEPGDEFLGFLMLHELGAGAFARVYLATESKLGNRLVAVKVSPRPSAEADILGRINHPYIVPVHSVQTDAATGLTAVCMPYLGSATLCDLLDLARESQNPPARAQAILDAVRQIPHPLNDSGHPATPDPMLENGNYVDGVRLIASRIAQSLAYLHEREIVHRDLKPSNVLLSPAGVPMLLDFNLSVDSREGIAPFGGTVAYMAPEQLQRIANPRTHNTIDGRADLFALGVILYELLTGRHPFGPIPLKLSGPELARLLLEKQQVTITPAHLVNTAIDRAFSDLIQRCLAFDPAHRPDSSASVASTLERIAAPVTWLQRHRWKTIVAAALAIAATTTAAATIASLPHDETPPNRIELPAERPIDAGMRLCKAQDFRAAIPHLNSVLQADAQNVRALKARGRAHQMLGDFDLALMDYKKIDQIAPQGAIKAVIGYCLNKSEADRRRGALTYYEDAIKAGFATAVVYNNLGYCYRVNDQSQLARECLDEAIKQNNKLQVAYHNRGLLRLKEVMKSRSQLKSSMETMQIWQAGIDDLETAVGLDSPSGHLHLDAARFYALLADSDRRHADSMFQHLEHSVKRGISESGLKDALFDPFRSDPRIAAFAPKVAGRAATSRPPLIVDPIEECFLE